jgi:glycosyltransferase involved in cell wall biosynthesis
MEKLTVLQSFPVPRQTTNPYLVMLQDSLREVPETELLNFSWRNAFQAEYDVFHVHWPEILVNGRTPMRKAVRQVLTAGLLMRLALRGIPIVRTMHNLHLPEGISRREQLLLQALERRTDFRIALNRETPVNADAPYAVIPHGDYRQWFSGYRWAEAIAGRVGYVGLVRRYKGVEGLINAFIGTKSLMPGLTLHLAGNPTSPELRDSIMRLARNDPRIHTELEFVPDARLVEVLTSSELVVLPYRFMHNSGAILTALSLNRPVLVPRNDVNGKLSEEVGPGWVHMFGGELHAQHIVSTLEALRRNGQAGAPLFHGRAWPDAAVAHVEAYRRAIALSASRRKVVAR